MSDQDFSMAFVDSCDKLTVLLIHGFPLSSSLWHMQTPDLSSFARVIAPDLRGHGQSEAVDGPYSVQLLADDCADLLGHLAVPTPFVVCGLSMGGYVALEFYRRYPEYVAGLVLMATRAGADSAEGKQNRDGAIATVQKQGIEPIVEGMLPKLMASKTAASDPDLVEFVHEMMLETSPEGMIGALAAMRDRPDSTELLAEIDVPTLVIHGEQDQIIPISEAEAMAKAIPNATLVRIPNAGHLPNLEQADLVNDALIDFLELVEQSLQSEDDEDTD